MGFDKTVSLKIDDKELFNITATFIENEDKPDELFIELRSATHATALGRYNWKLLYTPDGVDLTLTVQIAEKAICLAGCLAAIFKETGPVLSCLRNAKTREEARACLNQYGLLEVIGSLSCIYGCLNIS